jgi:hypothetical protein
LRAVVALPEKNSEVKIKAKIRIKLFICNTAGPNLRRPGLRAVVALPEKKRSSSKK